MEIDWTGYEFQLADGQALRIARACGIEIRCVTGTLWLTEAGDGTDHFLLAGQSYRLRGNGLALVEGIGRASASIGRSPTILEKLRNCLDATKTQPRAEICA